MAATRRSRATKTGTKTKAGTARGARPRAAKKVAAKKVASKKNVAKKVVAKRLTAKPVAAKRPTGKVRPAPAKRRAAAREAEGPFDAILAPTAVVYAEEELRILSVAVDHPALGGEFLDRWTRHTKPGVPKRDLRAFREAMANVDVDARVAAVAAKLEKAWKTKLDRETLESVRADVVAMYRGD